MGEQKSIYTGPKKFEPPTESFGDRKENQVAENRFTSEKNKVLKDTILGNFSKLSSIRYEDKVEDGDKYTGRQKEDCFLHFMIRW